MNKEINLIYGKRKDAAIAERHIRLARLFAIGSVVFVVLCGSIIFILNKIASLPVVLQQEQTTVQNVSFLKNRLGKLLILKTRLKDISSITSHQLSLDDKLSKLLVGIPSDATIETLDIDQKTITLVASSNSLASINNIIDFATTSVTKKQLFKKITINSISADVHVGKYAVSIQGDPL